MKKILVVGVGAQGSTIAKRMDKHPDISEIICADYDIKAAQELQSTLGKAKALQLDARGVDLNLQPTVSAHQRRRAACHLCWVYYDLTHWGWKPLVGL